MALTTYTSGEVLTAQSLNDNLVFAAANPPASASGLTFINSTTFATVASVSLPVGTFSASFLNYLVLFNLSAASTTLTMTGRMRVASADNTGSQYFTMITRTTSQGSNGIIGNAGQSSFSMSTTTAANYAASMIFMNPFAARLTSIQTQINALEVGQALLGLAGSLSFDGSTSFDSFSFIASTGTISGTVKVYGYANS